MAMPPHAVNKEQAFSMCSIRMNRISIQPSGAGGMAEGSDKGSFRKKYI
jgi:hypothetical protein